MSTPSYDFGSPVNSPEETDVSEETYPTPSYVSSYEQPATDDEHDDEDEAEEDASTADTGAKRKARRPGASRATKLTAAQVRRVLSQAESIEALDAKTRRILSAILGSSSDLEDLVVATLSPSKAAASVISEIEALANEENPYAKMLNATIIAGDRDSSRRVWGVLTALGKVEGGIPAKEVVAGQKIAEAVDSLSSHDLETLTQVSARLGA